MLLHRVPALGCIRCCDSVGCHCCLWREAADLGPHPEQQHSEHSTHADGAHAFAANGARQGLAPITPAWLSMAHAVIAATAVPKLTRPAIGQPNLPTGCLRTHSQCSASDLFLAAA